jgi:hypothetical protein
MNTTKTLLAGVIAGVVAFLGGWLVYGMALQGFMEENLNQCASIPMDDMNMGLMFAGNLCWGLTYAFILAWAGTNSLMGGIKNAALIALFSSLSMTLQTHSMTTVYSNTTAIAVDVLASVVISSLMGAAIGWFYGRGAKSEA